MTDNITITVTETVNDFEVDVVEGIGDAPVDGSVYGRQDSVWVDVSEMDFIDFNLLYADGSAEGRLQWNSEDGTLEVGLPGGNVNLQIGEETLIRATNDQGEQINNGKVVRISGGTGNFPDIKYADKSSIATAGAIGFATENIATSQKGYVTQFGLVRDVNTDGIAVGTPLWLGDDGVYTSTVPTAPDIKVIVGTVIRSHASEGIILAHPQTVARLRGLSDVHSPTTPNDNDVIYWNTSSSRWQIGTVGSITGGWTGSFTNGDANTVTVVDGIITNVL